MFGTNIPTPNQILSITPDISTPTKILNHMNKLVKEQKQINNKIAQKTLQNSTYKNAHNKVKTFQIGDLVLHRQMQVSTGTSSKWKPIFQGPYIIEQNFPKTSSAILQHINTKAIIKAHYLHLSHVQYHPKYQKPQSSLINSIQTGVIIPPLMDPSLNTHKP